MQHRFVQRWSLFDEDLHGPWNHPSNADLLTCPLKRSPNLPVLPTLTIIWKEVETTANQSPQCVQTFLFISDDNSRA